MICVTEVSKTNQFSQGYFAMQGNLEVENQQFTLQIGYFTAKFVRWNRKKRQKWNLR